LADAALAAPGPMRNGLRAEEPRPATVGHLRLSEMDVLGRLGSVVSPVRGTAEFRLQLAQQRARSLKGDPLSPISSCGTGPTSLLAGLQEVYAQKAAVAMSTKSILETKEQRLVAMIEQMGAEPKASTSALNMVSELEMEVRKARVQATDAEESKNLGELALQYNSLQGDDKAQNGQRTFLSAVRASALASTRNIEHGAQVINQIRLAKAEIAATREREEREDREKQEKATLVRLSRPFSSPAIRQSRLPDPFNGRASSAPASAVAEDEKAKKERERWIQYVRESLKSQRSARKRKELTRRAPAA